MDDAGNTRDDLKVPEGDIGNEITASQEEGRDILVRSIPKFREQPHIFCLWRKYFKLLFFFFTVHRPHCLRRGGCHCHQGEHGCGQVSGLQGRRNEEWRLRIPRDQWCLENTTTPHCNRERSGRFSFYERFSSSTPKRWITLRRLASS